jgi:hypothetical protein
MATSIVANKAKGTMMAPASSRQICRDWRNAAPPAGEDRTSAVELMVSGMRRSPLTQAARLKTSEKWAVKSTVGLTFGIH